ncbi:sugar nucleotide-binding protein, partial [Achromobacter ruhlandii]
GHAVRLRALPSGRPRVTHVAPAGARAPAASRAVFVDGLNHVLDALDTRQVERIVFVSSSAVYGEHRGDWVDEDTPPAPQGFNGRILLEAEAALAARATPHTTLRLAGLYGPGRLQLIERLRTGKASAPLEPPHWANRTHIDHAAAAL